jgi:hypothetical protein
MPHRGRSSKGDARALQPQRRCDAAITRICSTYALRRRSMSLRTRAASAVSSAQLLHADFQQVAAPERASARSPSNPFGEHPHSHRRPARSLSSCRRCDTPIYFLLRQTAAIRPALAVATPRGCINAMRAFNQSKNESSQPTHSKSQMSGSSPLSSLYFLQGRATCSRSKHLRQTYPYQRVKSDWLGPSPT